MDFKVQRAGLAGKEWKTICTNPSEEYAKEVYERQLKYAAVGRFRLLNPDDKVIAEKSKTLFSDN